jgi:hypothetical protein
MKKQILNSLIAGAALTVAAAFSPAQAQPVPLALSLSGTATYNTNIALSFFGPYNGGGTNTTTTFAFTSTDLLNWLNNSSGFTNDLWNYTYTRSFALSFNATQGNKNNTAVGTGLLQLPAGSYFTVLGGVLSITNPAGFYYPLTSGYHNVSTETGVPYRHFPTYPWTTGYTPVVVYLNHTYLYFSVDRAVGQGNVNNVNGAEQDQATWTLYFDNYDYYYGESATKPKFAGASEVYFSVAGPLTLSAVEGNPAKLPASVAGLRSIIISGSGTGASYDNSYFDFLAPSQINAAFVTASIKLAGSGANYGFGYGANFFTPDDSGSYSTPPDHNNNTFFWPNAR